MSDERETPNVKEDESTRPPIADVDLEELKKVEADSEKKLLRHRLDDYVAIILGVGSAFVLWLLQLMGLY